MIPGGQRRTEERHRLVADKLVERAILFEDRLGRNRIKTIETLDDFSRRELFSERREAAHVDEQHRNIASLPARRSELVSQGAELRIFARRPNLHEVKRNGKWPEEWHQTLFAALSRGQMAVELAR